MAEKMSVRRTRRLRALWAKHYKFPEPPDAKDSFVDWIVMTVLWVDAPVARARAAYTKLVEEFIDWNDLRVSMSFEIASILEGCGISAVKAAALKRVLGRAVELLYSFDFGMLAPRPREELRNWFMGIEGLPHPIAAAILYYAYQFDRVLVDADIGRVIRRLGLAAETATEADIEKAIAEVIPAREAHFTYSALRQHALEVCTKNDPNCKPCPLRKECQAAGRLIAEQEAAARAARQKAKAKAKGARKKAKS